MKTLAIPHFRLVPPLAALTIACLCLGSCSQQEKDSHADQPGKQHSPGKNPEKETDPQAPKDPTEGGPTENEQPIAETTPPTDPSKTKLSAYSTAGWSRPDTSSQDEIVNEYIALTSEEERIARIGELALDRSKSLGEILRRALQDDSDSLRKAAILAAPSLDDADAIELLSAATTTEDVELAKLAQQQATLTGSDNTLITILQNSLQSTSPEVRSNAVDGIAAERPKYYIDSIFPSLDDPDPTVATTTAEVLTGLFGEEFQTSEEANTWWLENTNSYDEHLDRVADE